MIVRQQAPVAILRGIGYRVRMPSKRHGCACPACQECCRREPGWFVPQEVPQAAAYLNLAEQEFIAEYCAGHESGGAIALSPAQKPGRGECVFLTKDGLCQIHEVKPFECRKVFGCEAASRHRRIREIIAEMWK